MRSAFINELMQIAQTNPQVILLTGDLGFSVLEEFQKRFPRQFINAGVAEQNMTGVAAGLALAGKIPVIYSVVPFVTMRNFEQIRNDICYQNLNVKIVGVSAGFATGAYGYTHYGLEDIGIIRTLPNMIILAPGDPAEVTALTKSAVMHSGPVYMRIGKAGETSVHKDIPRLKIGKSYLIKDGRDVTVISATAILGNVSLAVAKARKTGISVRFVSMPTIKPLDKKEILQCAKKSKIILTVEEHSIIGGLGSAVAEVLAESGLKTRLLRIGVPDRFTKAIGRQEFMRKANGLSTEQIYTRIIGVLK